MSVISNNQLAGASGQGGSGYQIDRSLRFNSDDSAYLSRDFPSAGDQTKWTWSGWVKRSDIGSARQQIFGNTTAGTIPIAIDEVNKMNLLQSGEFLLLAAFGGGFTWGSMLIRWGKML